MSKIKWGNIAAIVGVPALVGGLFFANKYGMLSPGTAASASVPQVAAIPEMAAPAAAVNVVELPQPSTVPASVPGQKVRSLHMAWNAQFAECLANGGPETTKGSLMEKHGVNLSMIREDDTGKMAAQLVLFATAMKKGDPAPKDGAQFMAVMGDGSAATIAGLLDLGLRKLGPDYAPEVIGSAGYSRGEDGIWGPAAWKTDPKAARGSLLSVYLRDGDWNIVMKWAFDNGIKVNYDEKTWDPTAINFFAADDFMKAAEAYITSVCEDRPVVIDGKRNGEKHNVCINAVSTWTPADVNIAEQKGGLVKIISTKDYRSQMPNTIIGIRKWDQDNRKTVEGMLAAMYEAGDQVNSFESARKRAGEASAAVYKEKDGAYWLKYYNGAVEPDKTGVKVELGGSSVNNLQDALFLFGLTPGSPPGGLFAATYTAFGDVVKKGYPKLVPSYPPYTDVVNTSYLENVAKASTSKTVADMPVYQALTEIKAPVSKRAWAINFETGKATFTPDSMGQLQELSYGLLIADALSIEIQGHTDNTGDPARNLSLSQARAEAVKAWLMKQSSASFPASRFAKVQGFGDTEPAPGASNETEAGRAKNRRVEVVLGKQ